MRTIQRAAWLVSLAVLTVGGPSLAAEQFQTRSPINARWSGTYELESSRGDNAQRAADTATRSLPPGQRDRAYQNLLSRLEPPQWLSLERDGRTVTIASSRGPRSEFEADGRPQRERGPDGQTATTRAEINDNRLRVSTSGGSRGSDFLVTFESLNDGDDLRVTRRLDDEDLQQPVTIQSYYRRTMARPSWDVYGTGREDDRDFDTRPALGAPTDMNAVRNGTRILATLDTPLSMRTSRTGEPFTMTVRTPEELRGARIDGVVSRVDARRTSGDGRDLRLDFQRIEWRGWSSDFDASLNTVRLADGTLVRIDAEGEVRDGDRGETTVRNGTIGAAVGAVIGAIAGGRTGAVLGAVVGGAGGVILSQDHEQLDLPRGAEVTLTAVTSSRRAPR